MDFNVNIPEWENEGTEPNEELIQGGFEEKYKPPANIFNWFWHKVTTGVAELQSKLSGEETARISADNTLQNNINAKADSSALTSHASNTSNPHSVTKSQVGLDNVDNTSDLNKPVSTATQTALNAKADKTDLVKYDNAVNLIPYPHNYTEYTYNGVAAKGDYGDGRITFNGTTTGAIFSEYYNNPSKPLTGKLYYIVKNYTGNSLRCEAYNGSSWLADFSITDGTVKKITNATRISVYTTSVGETFNNVEIYPVMISEDDFVDKNVYNIMRMQTALDTKADKTAVVENNDGIIIGYPYSAGWYRIAMIETTSNDTVQGSPSNSFEIIFKTSYSNSSPEYHHLEFLGRYQASKWMSISNFTGSLNLQKIRHVVDTTPDSNGKRHAYIEVYYASSYTNGISVTLNNVRNAATDRWKLITPVKTTGTDTTPQNGIIYSDYKIPANSELAQKEVVLWGGGIQSINPYSTVILNDKWTNYSYLVISIISPEGDQCEPYIFDVDALGTYGELVGRDGMDFYFNESGKNKIQVSSSNDNYYIYTVKGIK